MAASSSSEGAPLSVAEVEAFVRDGYAYVREAFAASVAAECREILWQWLEREHGIREGDHASYRRAAPRGKLYISEHFTGGPWDRAACSPKLRNAIAQLCGADRLDDENFPGCGWWVLTFPGYSEPPWGPEGAWHVDGHGYAHRVDSAELGIVPIFLFSDVGPGDGGTALARGSHRRAAAILATTKNGMPGPALSAALRAELREDDVVETQGRAGDVLLAHPFLLHARSKNLSPATVRFMCHPGLPLKEPLRIRVPPPDPTPVEQAVLGALSEDDRIALLLGFHPSHFGGIGGKKRRRRKKNPLLLLRSSSDDDDDVEEEGDPAGGGALEEDDDFERGGSSSAATTTTTTTTTTRKKRRRASFPSATTSPASSFAIVRGE